MLTKLKYFFLSALVIVYISHIVPVNHVDKDLRSYYNMYMTVVNEFCKPSQYWYPKHVRIYITDLKDPTIGLCSFSYPSAFDITIDRSEFNKFSVTERFQLVAHEMRHCLFRVGHSNDPNNYMAPEFIHIDQNTLAEQVVEDIVNSCQ